MKSVTLLKLVTKIVKLQEAAQQFHEFPCLIGLCFLGLIPWLLQAASAPPRLALGDEPSCGLDARRGRRLRSPPSPTRNKVDSHCHAVAPGSPSLFDMMVIPERKLCRCLKSDFGLAHGVREEGEWLCSSCNDAQSIAMLCPRARVPPSSFSARSSRSAPS